MPRVFLLADDDDPGGLFDAVHSWPADCKLRVGFGRTGAFVRSHLGIVTDCRWLLGAARPEVLHADGPGAVRFAYALSRLLPPARRFKLVTSGASRTDRGLTGWLTRRGLRAADRVVARTAAEADRYAAAGVPADRLTVVPFGVPPAPPPPDPVAFRRSLAIPESGRLILAAGRFRPTDGLKAAVWAFDVIKYAAPDLYLVLVGDGPERDRLERFGKALGFDDYRVRFAGERADRPAVIGLAEVVWVTHDRGGTAAALEAMAAGRPVVAVRTPDLAEVVEDGVTGRLIPPGDRVRLAAVTHELLERPADAAALGAAGRDRAVRGFSAPAMVDRFARLYDGLLSGSAAAA
jgi:glycosyltransferase involved in cell wall biosynthesis